MWDNKDMEEKLREEAKQAVKAEFIGQIELERRARLKERRKKRWKRFWKLIKLCVFIGIGVLIGIHWKAIVEFIKTGKAPKIPKNHCYCPLIELKDKYCK